MRGRFGVFIILSLLLFTYKSRTDHWMKEKKEQNFIVATDQAQEYKIIQKWGHTLSMTLEPTMKSRIIN